MMQQKKKNDESSKYEQIGTGQTSNVKVEEINSDNIPLNKLYMHRHIAKKNKNKKKNNSHTHTHKHKHKQTRFRNEALYYIT